MTAPARTGRGAPSPARSAKPRERALKVVPTDRRRSAAVERAYARRAQRGSARGPAVTRQPVVTPKAPFVVMVMVVLGVGIAAIMWLSTQATADSYRLQDARAEETRLARQVEQLRQEVALAESPLSLADAAAKLGMLPAGDPARLRKLPDGTIEVYGKPSAVQPPPPPTTATPPADTPPPDQQPPNQDPAQTPPDQAASPPAQPPAGTEQAGSEQAGQQPAEQPVPGGQ
ncbi:hypothetical protein ACRAKI_29025 [Saccharothrix isguenensis]